MFVLFFETMIDADTHENGKKTDQYQVEAEAANLPKQLRNLAPLPAKKRMFIMDWLIYWLMDWLTDWLID